MNREKIDTFMNKKYFVFNKMQKMMDKILLVDCITECAYDGLFDYKENCHIAKQLRWLKRNHENIFHAQFLMSKLFNTKKWGK